MKKTFSLMIAAIVLSLIPGKVGEPAKAYSGTTKAYFDIKSMQSTVKKDYAFIQVKYKCNLKHVEAAELKLYVLLKKGSQKKLASGTFSLKDVEKGRYKEKFMIKASYIREYGRPRYLRAEIWYKDRIRAGKTKPRPKEKWWEKKAMSIITRSDEDLERLLRRTDDD